MTIGISGAQARALASLIAENGDGEGVALTAQGDGSLYVGFSLASFSVAVDGDVEEAG